MLISWNPRASLAGGKLEIADGAHTVTTDIQSGQRSTTFQPQNRQVVVTVSSNPSRGRYFSETASFQVTGPPAPPPPRIRATGEELNALEREVQQLQASLVAGHQQADNLELRIRWLMDRLHNNAADMRR